MGFPLSLIAGLLALGLGGSAQAPALKIVVVEGEGGVNIIQQKTAVRPLVEVRDRNNLPVPGAAVTFTIGGGGQSAAFAGGVQTLTVTTNAAGQAAASGLNAIGSGAFQIQVQAAYQGQIATAAISQTNFATAAAAAQAGAGGGAAGGGGGMSATTIGIVGAAVGGGALAATKVVGDKGNGTPQAEFTGTLSGQFVFTNVGTNPQNPGSSTCASTRSITGTMKITMNDDNVTGKVQLDLTYTEISLAGASCIANTQPAIFSGFVDVTGGPSALTFTITSQQTGGTGTNGTSKAGFKGALSGSTITGTLAFEMVSQSSNTLNGITSTFSGSGSTTMQVTLQKQ
jgi:hypothetical protein